MNGKSHRSTRTFGAEKTAGKISRKIRKAKRDGDHPSAQRQNTLIPLREYLKSNRLRKSDVDQMELSRFLGPIEDSKRVLESLKKANRMSMRQCLPAKKTHSANNSFQTFGKAFFKIPNMDETGLQKNSQNEFCGHLNRTHLPSESDARATAGDQTTNTPKFHLKPRSNSKMTQAGKSNVPPQELSNSDKFASNPTSQPENTFLSFENEIQEYSDFQESEEVNEPGNGQKKPDFEIKTPTIQAKMTFSNKTKNLENETFTESVKAHLINTHSQCLETHPTKNPASKSTKIQTSKNPDSKRSISPDYEIEPISKSPQSPKLDQSQTLKSANAKPTPTARLMRFVTRLNQKQFKKVTNTEIFRKRLEKQLKPQDIPNKFSLADKNRFFDLHKDKANFEFRPEYKAIDLQEREKRQRRKTHITKRKCSNGQIVLKRRFGISYIKPRRLLQNGVSEVYKPLPNLVIQASKKCELQKELLQGFAKSIQQGFFQTRNFAIVNKTKTKRRRGRPSKPRASNTRNLGFAMQAAKEVDFREFLENPESRSSKYLSGHFGFNHIQDMQDLFKHEVFAAFYLHCPFVKSRRRVSRRSQQSWIQPLTIPIQENDTDFADKIQNIVAESDLMITVYGKNSLNSKKCFLKGVPVALNGKMQDIFFRRKRRKAKQGALKKEETGRNLENKGKAKRKRGRPRKGETRGLKQAKEGGNDILGDGKAQHLKHFETLNTNINVQAQLTENHSIKTNTPLKTLNPALPATNPLSNPPKRHLIDYKEGDLQKFKLENTELFQKFGPKSIQAYLESVTGMTSGNFNTMSLKFEAFVDEKFWKNRTQQEKNILFTYVNVFKLKFQEFLFYIGLEWYLYKQAKLKSKNTQIKRHLGDKWHLDSETMSKGKSFSSQEFENYSDNSENLETKNRNRICVDLQIDGTCSADWSNLDFSFLSKFEDRMSRLVNLSANLGQFLTQNIVKKMNRKKSDLPFYFVDTRDCFLFDLREELEEFSYMGRVYRSVNIGSIKGERGYQRGNI